MSEWRVPQAVDTLGDLVDWTAAQLDRAGVFFGHGTDTAEEEAIALIWHLGGYDFEREVDLRQSPGELLKSELELLLEQRIRERIPLPYLTGIAWFCRLPWTVDARVLIPRSPFGELIEAGISPWFVRRDPRRVLDLCCGSGCIGIAVAKVFPDASVDLADLDEDALDVARLNCIRHDTGDRVKCVRSDLFTAIGGERYDLIVSNPPYVNRENLDAMPAEFHHEPRRALEAGEDGLDLVSDILDQAVNYLTEDGVLIVEVGQSAPALQEKYPHLPFVWLEFERGGEGVFVLEARDL